MPLPESIRRAWLATDYRVRSTRGGCVSIRCGAPLPALLFSLLPGPDSPWGYITAWNPASVRLPRTSNRARQRHLRDDLLAANFRCHPGVGVGPNGWREPSLFVPGIDYGQLDTLARRYGQIGVVRGTGAGPTELHALV